MAAAVQRVQRWRWRDGAWESQPADVAVEMAVTVFVNGQEFITVAMTPDAVAEWAIGFLTSEGLIRHPDEVTVLDWWPEEGQVWVRIPGLPRDALAQFGRRVLSACCGRGRAGVYFSADADLVEPVPVHEASVGVDDIVRLTGLLGQRSRREPSGGLHMAALALPPWQEVEALYTDVGRHNALDKVWGFALRRKLPLAGGIVVFSGRLSSEVLLKVIKMRCGVIVAHGAPTSLGLALADTYGVTAIGFAREDGFSVYTHPERMAVRSALTQDAGTRALPFPVGDPSPPAGP
ncbi:MAG: formate dehydrogenase accessory sulfurtransferase FdhD [Firmicutes bacterium]|nr:formate dehydrogenase accessory sulfurtransferase FdhD [Alicyclobacillaceae bacterium]MCL6497879.1 formate dehydrogenase accessory sulfurtransferase FdhD [Bacillota bacterium]